MTGCTVSGNSAIGNLSYAPSRGGGIANYGALTLINSTVSGNSPSQGFGGGNSIVAGNADGDLFGDVDSDGYNVFGATNGTGFDPTDLLGVDPLLGPLQDNGGPTPTRAPLAGSPALDRIPGTPGVDFPATDQRGVSRPQAAKADSGAVEAGDSPGFQVTGVAPHSGTAIGGTPITIAGIGFLPGASVKIGGVLAQDVDVLSPTEIHATTPPLSPGTLNDVVVTNPASAASSPLDSALLPDGWLADFVDVPQGDPLQPFVESLVRNGITAGCGAGAYCRNDPVARQQMAVFLLKAEHGSAYVPPACQGSSRTCPARDLSPSGSRSSWPRESRAVAARMSSVPPTR